VPSLVQDHYDIAVIGGGINGVGIARDAAGRGLSVFLAEQHDLASHTSSASTKLIHGGLRYLETFEFRLVREALIERERLLDSAPHIIRPLRFILPHDPSVRPAWLIRLGLLLYDRLAPRRHLPGSMVLDLQASGIGSKLKSSFKKAFAYSDCWVDDSRLTALAALDAAERGANIMTRTRVVAAKREGGLFMLTIRTEADATVEVSARAIVNATGPWVAETAQAFGLKTKRKVRLVKGSHIVIPAAFAGDHAFIFQNLDKRVVFAIPYEGRFTLIGATDIPFDGDASSASASDAEIQYLCDCVGRYFAKPIRPRDVIWSFAGVRPLLDDGAENPSAVTRDYAFDLDAPPREAPALTIFGGKITTFRRLAQQAMALLRPHFPHAGPDWTATAKLPGGDFDNGDFGRFAESASARWPFLAPETAYRLARAHGTRMERILGRARSMADVGRDFGGGLTEAELDYLARDEWARTADDALWRRSKLGLHLTKVQIEAVAEYYEKRRAA
jgi:glycerol-3-phosphate dehydrogenase